MPPTATETAGDTPAPNPYVTLKLSPEELAKWFKEIKAAQNRRNNREKVWEILLKEYLPTVTESGAAEAVKTNAHFRNTHTKLAQLFNRLPDLQLEAKGPLQDPVSLNPQTGQPVTAEDAVIIKQAVLNDKLGIDGIDASRMMDEVLFDCLQWAGHGWVKIGYRVVVKPVQQPVMQPDPAFVPPPSQPGSILGLQPPPTPPMVPVMAPNPETGQLEPQMETIQVPIFDEWYAKRGSPKKLLLPKDLTSGRIDEDARWVGHEFFLTKSQSKRVFNYEGEAKGVDDDRLFKTTDDQGIDDDADKIHFYEIFLKGSEFHDECFHPQVIYQLVLAEGNANSPVVYRPSPDQTLDDQGRLTADSVIGFPLEVCYLRDFPDSPYPSSDAAFTNSQVKHMNTHRQQSVRLRDAAIARYLYDEGAFTPEEIGRIQTMKVGEFMAVAEGRLASGADKVITPLTQASSARDDYRLAQMIKSDMEETLGLGGPQVGVSDDVSRTATEVNEVGNKSALRMSKDQQRAINFYLRTVRKFDMYLQRYATTDDYVQVTGKDGMKRLAVWNNRVIAGRHAYAIKPDSQLMIDAARDRQQTMIFYEKTAADPLVNRYPIVKKLAALFSLDPAQVVNDPAVIAARQMAGGDGTAPAGPPTPDDPRAHRATGGMPNHPETGVAPNTQQQPNA